MNKNQCSGTFILLNATVNPGFEDAEYSRAGIFIKSTHPNPVNTVNSKFNYLRGPAEIARENGIELLGQWKMEFNIQNEPFWNEVISTAQRKSDLPLSRLYYWTDCFRLVGNSEAGGLLCVPIRSENGEILGVCGMEVSDRLFKQRYTPNDSGYRNVFTAFAPFKNQTIHIENGMIAGNYFLTGMRMENSMAITHTKNKMSFYQSEDTAYGGLHSEVKLYPNDSPYREQKWLVSVMMPKDIVTAAMNGKSRYLFVIVFLLLLISLFVSIFISKRYLRPVMEAIDSIKTKDYSKKPQKSVYLEINDLMDYLAQQDERLKNNAPAANSMHKIPMFEDFIENLKTLSSAERKVFDLYLEGYKAQEIADKLFLSINTIKTHNRRIFAKLNVSTRKELLVYVDMMKEMNRMSEV